MHRRTNVPERLRLLRLRVGYERRRMAAPRRRLHTHVRAGLYSRLLPWDPDVCHAAVPGGAIAAAIAAAAAAQLPPHILCKFNQHAGGARFVWNKAVDFIRRQPADEQSKWYSNAKLHPILLAQTKYKDRELRARKEEESSEGYAKYVADTDARRAKLAANKLAHADEGLIGANPWLGELSSVVLQQSLKGLQEAFTANLAAARVARATGNGVRRFKIGFKKRTQPSAWTFTLPATFIKAEHVLRPTHGPAALGQPQPQNKPRIWTKLTLQPHSVGLTRALPRILLLALVLSST